VRVTFRSAAEGSPVVAGTVIAAVGVAEILVAVTIPGVDGAAGVAVVVAVAGGEVEEQPAIATQAVTRKSRSTTAGFMGEF